jgi:hypothetical protein
MLLRGSAGEESHKFSAFSLLDQVIEHSGFQTKSEKTGKLQGGFTGNIYRVKKFPLRTLIGWGIALATLKDTHLLMLDSGTHRILVIGEDGDLIRHIGQIGQDKGALFSPQGLVCDFQGNMHVIDNGNHRIQTFTPEGGVVREFPITSTSESVAMSRSGITYVNMPRHGNIVSIYEWSGKLLGHFGELVNRSEGYPLLKDDYGMKVSLSRGYLAVGSNNDIYVTFQFVPIVRKYDPSGHLLWQVHLQENMIERFGKSMWDYVNNSSGKLVKNLDGIQFSPLITGSYLDSTDNLKLFLGDSSILTITSDGKQGPLLKPEQVDILPFLSATEWKGKMHLLSTGGCYRLL